jgi:hypothetical protein
MITDITDDCPTTRRYARTLHGVDSAFPRDPEYADPIVRFERALTWTESRWWLLFIAAGVIGALLAWWRSA